jgi:putative spermidine/putrescine transport system permease protein
VEQPPSRKQRPRLRAAAPVVPALAFTLIFFIAPLALLLAYSLFEFSGGEVAYRLTLANYTALLGSAFYLHIILRTFLVALVTTLICVALGYPVAWQIARSGPRLRALMVLGIVMPLLIGGVIRGYGWILILDRGGAINHALLALGLAQAPLPMLYNFFGVTLTMVEVLLPFFVLPLVGVLSNMDPALERAALSMGASRLQTFLRVSLPLSAGGVAAGASIVFSLAASIFVIPQIIGGPSYLLLSTLAYQQIGSVGNWPFGSAVLVLILVITLVVLTVGSRVVSGNIRRLQEN